MRISDWSSDVCSSDLTAAARAGGRGHRQDHGSCRSDRRASGLSPGRRPPFSARRRAMRLDVGAVDGGAAIDRALPGQCFEYLKPEPLTAPAINTVVAGRVGDIGWRKITPPGTRQTQK